MVRRGCHDGRFARLVELYCMLAAALGYCTKRLLYNTVEQALMRPEEGMASTRGCQIVH